MKKQMKARSNMTMKPRRRQLVKATRKDLQHNRRHVLRRSCKLKRHNFPTTKQTRPRDIFHPVNPQQKQPRRPAKATLAEELRNVSDRRRHDRNQQSASSTHHNPKLTSTRTLLHQERPIIRSKAPRPTPKSNARDTRKIKMN